MSNGGEEHTRNNDRWSETGCDGERTREGKQSASFEDKAADEATEGARCLLGLGGDNAGN